MSRTSACRGSKPCAPRARASISAAAAPDAPRLACAIAFGTRHRRRRSRPLQLPKFSRPIYRVLALDLAAWGVADPLRLAWLDPPPASAWKEAVALARDLGALDADGRLTEEGKALRALPLPPRLARMLVLAARHGAADRAAMLAMALSERGLGGVDADLTHRLARLGSDGSKRAREARRLAASWARLAQSSAGGSDSTPLSDGALVALAFPDRLAKARGAKGEFLMANGRAAGLPLEDPLSRAPFLAVAELTGRAAQARILAACALEAEEVEAIVGAHVETHEETVFDPARAGLRRRRVRRLGAIRLSEQNLAVEPSEASARTLALGLASLGLSRLPWTKAQVQLRDRVAFLRRAEGAEWPDLSDGGLAADVCDWLAPHIVGRSGLDDMTAADLDAALSQLLPYALQRRLDAEAPAHFETPAGARHALDYAAPNGPLLSVRVQELFGLATHPTLARGRAPLTLELLSPAHRPIQTTRDLPSFWAGSWNEVKKEMRGRYPRHPWPDDPTQAPPTTRATPRR